MQLSCYCNGLLTERYAGFPGGLCHTQYGCNIMKSRDRACIVFKQKQTLSCRQKIHALLTFGDERGLLTPLVSTMNSTLENLQTVESTLIDEVPPGWQNITNFQEVGSQTVQFDLDSNKYILCIFQICLAIIWCYSMVVKHP